MRSEKSLQKSLFNSVEDTSFQNINFHLKAQVLSLIKFLSAFLELTGSLCSFLKKNLPNTQVLIFIVYLSVFFKWKWRAIKKVASSAHSCINATLSPPPTPQVKCHLSVCNRSVFFMCTLHFNIQDIKKIFTLIKIFKINKFYYLIKANFKWHQQFFFYC